jgi:hypothetical protein
MLRRLCKQEVADSIPAGSTSRAAVIKRAARKRCGSSRTSRRWALAGCTHPSPVRCLELIPPGGAVSDLPDDLLRKGWEAVTR